MIMLFTDYAKIWLLIYLLVLTIICLVVQFTKMLKVTFDKFETIYSACLVLEMVENMQNTFAQVEKNIFHQLFEYRTAKNQNK